MTNELEYRIDMNESLDSQKCLNLIAALGKSVGLDFVITQGSMETRQLKYDHEKDSIEIVVEDKNIAVRGTFEIPVKEEKRMPGEPCAAYIQFDFGPGAKGSAMRYLELKGVGQQLSDAKKAAQKKAFEDIIRAYDTARPVYHTTLNAGVHVIHEEGRGRE